MTVIQAKRDLLSIADLSAETVHQMLDAAARLKQRWQRGVRPRPFADRTLALLFEKPSLRTRLSFELAMRQLGGESLFLGGAEVGLGRRESVADIARALSASVDVIAARTFAHATVQTLARHSSVPVINGLSDLEHPCQVLADLLTLRERFGRLRGLTLAYVGDGNNVAASLLLAAPLVGMNVCVAAPEGYDPPVEIVVKAGEQAATAGSWMEVCRDAALAVADADAVYADAWYSMGQEHEAEVRRTVFQPYQVNAQLMAGAPAHAVAMHCLPAHRGDEITDEVLDGSASLAFQQAANRLHAQKAVLLWALEVDLKELAEQ